MDSNSSTLSRDMAIEIISRTSLRTFDAMRCTSKEINKLTYDSSLMNLHTKRKHIVSGLITQAKITNRTYPYRRYSKEFAPSRESKSLDLGFLPDNAQIKATSEHGIMVLEGPCLRYYLCKPATKQLIQLPYPKPNSRTDEVSIVVMNSHPLRFKIFRFSLPEKLPCILKKYGTSRYCCETFDSSSCELEWRLADHIKVPNDVFLMRPVIIRGWIYSLLTNRDIWKFDAYLEKWTSTFSVPKETSDDIMLYSCIKLMKYEGRLALACRKHDSFWEIWVLDTDESWVKTYCLNNNEDAKRMSLQALHDSHTSIMSGFYRVLYHTFKSDGKLSSRSDDVSFKTTTLYDETFVFRSDFDVTDLGCHHVDLCRIPDQIQEVYNLSILYGTG